MAVPYGEEGEQYGDCGCFGAYCGTVVIVLCIGYIAESRPFGRLCQVCTVILGFSDAMISTT